MPPASGTARSPHYAPAVESMFDSDSLDVETVALTKKARELEGTPAATLAQARARADAWRRLEDDPEPAEAPASGTGSPTALCAGH